MFFVTYIPSFAVLTILLLLVLYTTYYLVLSSYFSPLRNLPGPPSPGIFGSHLPSILNPNVSARASEKLVQQYGRTFCIRGFGAQDHRLMTLDPVAMSHVLNSSAMYEKPWMSRRLITGMVGEGMLAAEGSVHKRQRKVSNPAFSRQSLYALMPILFQKAEELRDRFTDLIENSTQGTRIDVSHWLGCATFDIIGLAGFDYQFHAIQGDSNKVYRAYKDIFDVALSRREKGNLRSVLSIYLPVINTLFPDTAERAVVKSHRLVNTVMKDIVRKKKSQLNESAIGRNNKDLLSLLLKSNMSTDIAEDQRISEGELINQISTFIFVGTDTTSIALTWALYLLARHPEIQEDLRHELRQVIPFKITQDETDTPTIFSAIDALPLLDRVLHESLRLMPPIHSTIRVAMHDDEIPLSEPVTMKDGSKRSSIHIGKGQFVHVPIESFNLDRGVWGEDGWEFRPDRWLDLPEKITDLPGIYSHLLTFSAGPRSCIGLKFAITEFAQRTVILRFGSADPLLSFRMKIILHALVSNLVFSETEEILKHNA